MEGPIQGSRTVLWKRKQESMRISETKQTTTEAQEKMQQHNRTPYYKKNKGG